MQNDRRDRVLGSQLPSAVPPLPQLKAMGTLNFSDAL